MKQFFPPAILLILLFTQCGKGPQPASEVMPAITTEGKNSMGFTIDGKLWLPYGECQGYSLGCQESGVFYGQPYAQKGAVAMLFIRTKNAKSSSLQILSGINKITGIGEKIDSVDVWFQSDGTVGAYAGNYSVIQPGSKFIITRLDSVNKVISGEFEFILTESNGGNRSVHLEEGRFDFQLPFCKCR